MEITHSIKTSAQSFTGSTAGFDITTECHAVLIDNTGDDDVKIYFNNEALYYLLKSGTGLPIRVDSDNELIRDVMKLEFVTINNPLVNTLRQTKAIIS